MLDLYNFPIAGVIGAYDVQAFSAPCATDDVQWQTWIRPRGVSMCHILCIGGGAGGGGGDGDTSSFGRPGGAGGGSSGQTRVICSLDRSPDRLYVQVGAGGAGGIGLTLGVGGVNGASGLLSYVSVAPDNTTQLNILALSASAAPTGGGASTGGNPSGGTGSTAAVIGGMLLAGLGYFTAIGGQAGAAGGTSNANGSPIALPITGALCTGGTGGGGVTATQRQGEAFTLVSGSYLSEQIPAPQAAGPVNGCGRYGVNKPFFQFGGQGGGSSTSTATGLGGDGGYGAGGGGGGGALTTGGTGGSGGGGIVVITCW